MQPILLVIRHGEIDYSTFALNARGKEQILVMARAIKNLIPEEAWVHIFSSNAKRASESADILAEVLDAPVELHEELRTRSPKTDCPPVLEMVRSKQGAVDVIILMTHLEYALDFPVYYGREELGTEFAPSKTIDNGAAFLITRRSKKIFYLDPRDPKTIEKARAELT